MQQDQTGPDRSDVVLHFTDSKIIDNVNITMSTAKTVKVNVASAEQKVSCAV